MNWGNNKRVRSSEQRWECMNEDGPVRYLLTLKLKNSRSYAVEKCLQKILSPDFSYF